MVGGESGPSARPCKLEWIEQLVEQCVAQRIPVWVKQLGRVLARELDCRDREGRDMDEWPEHLRLRQWPESMKEVRQ